MRSFLWIALAAVHGAVAANINPDMAHNMRVLQTAMNPAVFSNYQKYLHSYTSSLSRQQAQEEAQEQRKAVEMRQQAFLKQQQMQQMQQQQQQQQQMQTPMQVPQASANPFQMQQMQQMQPMMQPVQGQALSQPMQPIPVSYLPGQQSLIPSGQQQPQQQAASVPPSPSQLEARRIMEQERKKWDSPAIFNNYKQFMKQHSAPPIPDQVQREYRVHEGQNVLCGPVPLRPIKLSQPGDLEACREKCSELVTCVGFVTDLAQTKCLFRSWDSLQTCKKRYHMIMQSDDKTVTLLKSDLILDGLNN